MQLVMYSVFDKAVGAYMRPFFLQSDGQAVRFFMDEINAPDSAVGRHPEDYSLFRLGVFNDADGGFEPCEPLCVGRAHELKSVSVSPLALSAGDPRLDFNGERPIDRKADLEDRDAAS